MTRNLALSCVSGETLESVVNQMLLTLKSMIIQGRGVETNRPVLMGLLEVMKSWFQSPYRLPTSLVKSYLSLVAFAAESQGTLNQAEAFRNSQKLKGFLSTAFENVQSHDTFMAYDQFQLSAWDAEAFFKGEYELPIEKINGLLDPPPVFDHHEFLSPSGGCFYAQLSPQDPPLVSVGQTVKKGDVLGVVEVMKMFNPLAAPADVVVTGIHVANGDMITKGQPLMVFEPIEVI